MSLPERHTKALRKKARHGFRGYPVATVAYYGPDARRATKVAVAVIPEEGAEPIALERWFNEQRDVRRDHDVNGEILRFIRSHGVHSVALTGELIGCPHEEGIDYPEGEVCPQCPYWAGRDRWAGVDEQTVGATHGRATEQAQGESLAATVNHEIGALLEGQDLASMEDVQAFLDQQVAERNRRAVDDFVGLSPEQMGILLYSPFESPPLATLEQRLPATLDAPILVLFRMIADAAADKGIKLTARGNLPLKLVKAADAWLLEDEANPRQRIGGISTEQDVDDFHCTRLVAELAGLLRKSRGYLYLTRRAEKMLAAEDWPALYRRLFETWTTKFNWAYRDGFGDLRIIQQSFGFTLHLLREYGDHWQPTAMYADAFLRAFPMALDEADDGIGVLSPEHCVRIAWSSRSLTGFGYLFGLVHLALPEVSPPPTAVDCGRQVRATPLLSSVYPQPPADVNSAGR